METANVVVYNADSVSDAVLNEIAQYADALAAFEAKARNVDGVGGRVSG